MNAPYAEVIGDPIAQSKSPLIHKFWLEKAGIEGDYRSHQVKAGDLADYLELRRADPDWLGCNVTMPHKQTIMPLLDQLDPLAERVGAVNTVIQDKHGTLTGYNTDVAGFLEPLRELLKDKHLFRMARIFGAGGAARAIVTALSNEGFVIVLAARNPDKARALLDELAEGGDHHAPPLGYFAKPTDFEFDDREGCCDLMINASPLGMRGQVPLDLDLSHTPPGSIFYDIVTDPVETAYLRAADEAGFETIDGLSMLIGQAAAAFERFFGHSAPRDCDAELRERLVA